MNFDAPCATCGGIKFHFFGCPALSPPTSAVEAWKRQIALDLSEWRDAGASPMDVAEAIDRLIDEKLRAQLPQGAVGGD